MSDLTQQAMPAVERLLKADEAQLYEQLGIRAKAIAVDPTKAGSFEPEVTYDQAQMGLKEDVLEAGRRLYSRWNVEAYKLVCGTDPEDQKDRKNLTTAFSFNEVTVAATLSALLVTYLGLAPALAAVIAALTIKRFFRPAYEEFCRVWKKNLPHNE